MATNVPQRALRNETAALLRRVEAGELHHGVLIADEAAGPGRLEVLLAVERTFEALPIDGRVVPHFGRLVAEARRRHGARPRAADASVAATARSHGLPLYTRDRDYELLDVPGLVVV